MLKFLVRIFPVSLALILASCVTPPSPYLIRVSVPDQKMLVFEQGAEIARYDVSTSKFGVGDRPGSYATPLGTMQVAQKIGGGAPSGMKFKSRRQTGEIVPPNSPGRDPIVSRILWLRGTEAQNRRAFDRGIYIHGTAEEWSIGTPASYGCIRMRSRDVIALYDKIAVGSRVEVINNHFPEAVTHGSGESSPVQQFTMPAATPANASAPAKPIGPITPTPGTSAPPPALSASSPGPKRG